MRSAIRLFITRVARTGLLLVFALGAPSIGGAFRCCSSGAHGTGAAHVVASPTAPTADHASAHHHVPDDPDARGKTPPADAPCDCVGHCCAAPVQAQVAPSVRFAEVACAESSAPDIARSDRSPAGRLDFLLPFANGPPALLTA